MKAFDKWLSCCGIDRNTVGRPEVLPLIERAFNAGMTSAAEICTNLSRSIPDSRNGDCAKAIEQARDTTT